MNIIFSFYMFFFFIIMGVLYNINHHRGNSKDGSANHGCGGPYHISRKEPPSGWLRSN
jgi:hypothetical protein